MRQAEYPIDEPERLEALRRFGILDTPPEERFDRLTRMISRYLGVPICLVTLIDERRQWIKSAFGLDVRETHRDLAFCSHAILEDELMIVEDASLDERFCEHPFVTNEPEIRFYAGAQLVTKDGYRLGTICAVDRVPRTLSAKERQFLADTAAIVMDELELSAATNTLEAQSRRLVHRNQSLDAFVHSLAHEMAGPILLVKSLTDLLKSDSKVPMKECVEHLSRSADDAAQLIDDLRSFFLIDGGADASRCNLRACLTEAFAPLEDELREAGGRVEISGEWCSVRFNPSLLRTLFRNLLSNAIKFRSDRPLVIRIHGAHDSTQWSVCVSDNGIGIESDHQERVFELLVRLHSEADIPGSGMGLPICERIVNRAGGVLTLGSRVGHGTDVTVSMPKGFGTTPKEDCTPPHRAP